MLVIVGLVVICTLNSFVAVRPFASATCTVKVLLPVAVGVPVRAPEALRVRPAGRVPVLTVQE